MNYVNAIKLSDVMGILLGSASDDELSNSNRVNFVYIPPKADAQSDLEDIDDEVIEENEDLDKDIAGEIQLEYEINDNHPEVDESFSELVPVSEYKRKGEFGIPKWRKRRNPYSREPLNIESTVMTTVANQLAFKSPYDICCYFLDDELVDMIVGFTNEYAS